MNSSETALRVTALAAAIRDYWDTELPKRHPNYPVISEGEDSGPPPPQYEELRQFLLELPAEEIYKLTVLMHVGRGGVHTHSLTEKFQELEERFPSPDQLVSLMLGNASLADDLEDGLEELKRNGIDVNDLSFRSVSHHA